MTVGRCPTEPGDPGRDDWTAGFLHGQVDACLEDDARFEELTRWWLRESKCRLCPAVWDRVASGDPSVRATVGRIGIPWLGDSEWWEDYTPESFGVLLSSLWERGLDGYWSIDPDRGTVGIGDCAAMSVSFSTGIGLRQHWVSFSVSAWYRGPEDGVIPYPDQATLIDLVAECSERSQASFANLADDNDSGQTALEVFLPRNPVDSVLQSPDVLRGYSWVTVCPPNVAGRLGGPTALEASGAFVEVRPLDYGAVLLRATERFEQYDDAAMARVFRALAPALPPGKPKKIRIFDGQPTPRLVYEDSADYQH